MPGCASALENRAASPPSPLRRGLWLGTLLLGLTAAAPQRVVSLNLCTDELALLLTPKGKLASVTILAADRQETMLVGRAVGIPTNNGRMDSVAALRPDLVLTGGFSNRYATELAARLGSKVVDVRPANTLGELRSNIRNVAQAVYNTELGDRIIAALDADLDQVPVKRQSAVLLSGGGYTVRTSGLSATLLRHAGLEQMSFPGDRASIEQLIANPPKVIVITHYRATQSSRYQSWLAHPALRKLPKSTRILHVDGRAWTCLGPPIGAEIARLRARVRG